MEAFPTQLFVTISYYTTSTCILRWTSHSHPRMSPAHHSICGYTTFTCILRWTSHSHPHMSLALHVITCVPHTQDTHHMSLICPSYVTYVLTPSSKHTQPPLNLWYTYTNHIIEYSNFFARRYIGYQAEVTLHRIQNYIHACVCAHTSMENKSTLNTGVYYVHTHT